MAFKKYSKNFVDGIKFEDVKNNVMSVRKIEKIVSKMKQRKITSY